MRNPALWIALAGVLWSAPLSAQRIRRPVIRVLTMEATAFARARQATTAGTEAHEGIVAADPRVLPLGTRIRITGSKGYDGNYLVTDTGGAVKGRHIDLYLPSALEAKSFGTQTVRVTVRQIGKGKVDAQRKDTGSPPVRNHQ